MGCSSANGSNEALREEMLATHELFVDAVRRSTDACAAGGDRVECSAELINAWSVGSDSGRAAEQRVTEAGDDCSAQVLEDYATIVGTVAEDLRERARAISLDDAGLFAANTASLEIGLAALNGVVLSIREGACGPVQEQDVEQLPSTIP